MTSNHPDSLDEALIRPGRCDVRVHFGPPSLSQIESMYRRIKQSTQREAREFAQANTGTFQSLAELQVYLQRSLSTNENRDAQLEYVI